MGYAKMSVFIWQCNPWTKPGGREAMEKNHKHLSVSVIGMGKPWYGPFFIFYQYNKNFNGPFSQFYIAISVVNSAIFSVEWDYGYGPTPFQSLQIYYNLLDLKKKVQMLLTDLKFYLSTSVINTRCLHDWKSQ